jgi:hypothetical protein
MDFPLLPVPSPSQIPPEVSRKPLVGAFTLLQHGTDAEIKQGATYTALIAEDATLTPAID